MELQTLSNLSIEDTGPVNGHGPPENIDYYMAKLKTYADSLPYSIENNSKMQEILEFCLLRICQSVEARDFEGFCQWDSIVA
jgi:proteasome activator subunit 4